MKKIGFIDYFLDEWHANNYPKWIRESSKKHDVEIALAWQEKEEPGVRSLEKWCADYAVTPATSLEQVVEECDGLIVLAPNNPEVHERLADLALQSGKPVYIDKPFAPDRAAAERIFAKAEKHGTPLFSSSALRFGKEFQHAVDHILKGQTVEFASSGGGGAPFEGYAVHQLEMLVPLMGVGVQRVMQCGSGRTTQLILDYGADRRASMMIMPGHGFRLSACAEKDTVTLNSMTDFFPGLIEAILTFFYTGLPPVKKEETLEIVSVVDAGIKALRQPDTWISVRS